MEIRPDDRYPGTLAGYVDGERKYSTIEIDESVEDVQEFADYLSGCVEYLKRGENNGHFFPLRP
jgi:hypothetical protein